MVTLAQLWAPILLSAFLVFIGSSLVHMVLKWHNSDYRKLSNEDEVRAAIRKGNPPPGQYIMPYCTDPKEQAKPENQQKVRRRAGRHDHHHAQWRSEHGAHARAMVRVQHRRLVLRGLRGEPDAAAGHRIPPGVSGDGRGGFRVVCHGARSPGRSGWASPGQRRSRMSRTASSTRLLMAGAFGWLWPKLRPRGEARRQGDSILPSRRPVGKAFSYLTTAIFPAFGFPVSP